MGNDFFKQSFATIDYEQGHLEISGIYIPSPETGYSIGDIARTHLNIEDGINNDEMNIIIDEKLNEHNNNNNFGKESYQTPPEIKNNFKIVEGRSFLAFSKSEILEGESYQTLLKLKIILKFLKGKVS